MPKMKSHRGAAKRFKLTSGGLWKRSKANKSHKLAKKSSIRKRRLRQPGIVSLSEQKKLKRLLPYL